MTTLELMKRVSKLVEQAYSIIGPLNANYEPLQLYFHRDVKVGGVLFKKPSQLSICLPFCESHTEAEIDSAVYDALATYALHCEFMQAVEVHRTARLVHLVPRPKLEVYKSPKWWFYRKAFDRL